MQTPNQNDSEPQFDLTKLPPLPSLFSRDAIFATLLLSALSAWCFSTGNLTGGCLDLFLVVVCISLQTLRYRGVKKLHQEFRSLQAVHRILTTPTMVEEGNSMILTFIRPTDRLMNEMAKIGQKNKSPKK